MEKPQAVIFDMDGTLVNVDSIRHYVTEGQKNYHKFHMASVDCPPIDWVLDEARAFWATEIYVLIVTARSDRYYATTSWWLADHNVPHDELYMRRYKDNRPDYEVKKDILKEIRIKYDPVLAYDDNPNVIRLWEEHGIDTIHVPGWVE